jgi:hypothetical protein
MMVRGCYESKANYAVLVEVSSQVLYLCGYVCVHGLGKVETAFLPSRWCGTLYCNLLAGLKLRPKC